MKTETKPKRIASASDKLHFLKVLYSAKLTRIKTDLESNDNLTDLERTRNEYEREFIGTLLNEINTI